MREHREEKRGRVDSRAAAPVSLVASGRTTRGDGLGRLFERELPVFGSH